MNIPFLAITNWSSRPDSEIANQVEAARTILPGFCAAWGIPVPGIAFFSRDAVLPSSEAMIVSAVDSDGEAGTDGYHSQIGGVPLALWEPQKGFWVFVHEILEPLTNPLLDRWAKAPDGRLWWVEACDATEGDRVPVSFTDLAGKRQTLDASNYLCPAFFGLPNADGSSRCDWAGVASPWTIRPGGYSVTVNAEGQREDIGAARPDKGRSTSRVAMAGEAQIAAARNSA